eukprot:TRINITY_DN13841_c0_g1_i2.p2 TRINITY_DN13841_c0_g1~~TRINITY_DN13841_c0_g1_i2.p2  ORF type:complete len:111 (+),score=35.87 TRINITY_DN13841_c0_g1_i2:31-333(+)
MRLHKLAPETLTAADNDGKLPSHYAAQTGQEACLQLLHKLAPETLTAGDLDSSKQWWHLQTIMAGCLPTVQLLTACLPTMQLWAAMRQACSCCTSWHQRP